MKPSNIDRIKGELHEERPRQKDSRTGHKQPQLGNQRPKRKTRWQSPKESRPEIEVECPLPTAVANETMMMHLFLQSLFLLFPAA